MNIHFYVDSKTDDIHTYIPDVAMAECRRWTANRKKKKKSCALQLDQIHVGHRVCMGFFRGDGMILAVLQGVPVTPIVQENVLYTLTYIINHRK